MEARISICRRRENFFLKLKGNFNRRDSEEILEAMRRLVGVSLKSSSNNTQVFFTLQIHAQIAAPKKIAELAPESEHLLRVVKGPETHPGAG